MIRIGCIAVLLAVAGVGASAQTEPPVTLREAIERALRDNPSLVDSRLQRVLERRDAEEAERRFEPQWRVTTGAGYGYDQGESQGTGTASAGTGVEMLLPSGGRVSAGPEWRLSRTSGEDLADSASLVLRLVQPLGRGSGSKLSHAPIEQARLAERSNVLAFRAALMDVVTNVITAYRALVLAERDLAIREQALEDARRSREVVQLLVEARRLAQTELAQSDTDVTSREIDIVSSRNALADAKAEFAVLLGFEDGRQVEAAERLPPLPELPDLEGSLERALALRTDYQRSLLAVRGAEIGRVIAEDTRRWDVTLWADARFSGEDEALTGSLGDLVGGLDSRGSYAFGVDLSLPLGGAARRGDERTRLAAQIAEIRAKRALAVRKREIGIEVERAAERVRSSHRQVELAKDALALAEEQVRVEEGKLRLGLTSSYHMGRVRSALSSAESRVANARVEYLNALSSLDRVEGAVLERWGIVVDERPEAGTELPNP